MIMVSHDLAEIRKLSDRVFKIRDGKIIARGTPAEVFDAGADVCPSCRANLIDRPGTAPARER